MAPVSRVLRGLLVATLACFPTLVASHSWIEVLRATVDGVFVGQPGYARGNLLRTDPLFHDMAMTMLLTPNDKIHKAADGKIVPSDLMCGPGQTKNVQNPVGGARLEAEPSMNITMFYRENGHITNPELTAKEKHGYNGRVFVYGTNSSSPNDTLLKIHRVWNRNGTGGDRRGRLLANLTFDDGQCYENTGGPIAKERAAKYPQPLGASLPCRANFTLPEDVAVGKPYSIYWLWDWSAGGLTELYSTCIDIDVVGNNTIEAVDNSNTKALDDTNVKVEPHVH